MKMFARKFYTLQNIKAKFVSVYLSFSQLKAFSNQYYRLMMILKTINIIMVIVKNLFRYALCQIFENSRMTHF